MNPFGTLIVSPARRITATSAVAVGWALLLLVAGCGAGDQDRAAAGNTPAAPPAAGAASSPETVDARPAASGECPLTAADVTTALGIEMAEGSSACSFTSSTSTFAEVHYEQVPAYVFGADEPTAVAGVGDKAYLGPSKELYVLAGNLSFSIHVLVSEIDTGIDGDAVQEQLARLVIQRAA